MSEMVLLGDEAVALGAVHAGISAAYAYPGTPSTEITEYIMAYSRRNGGRPLASWCSNEKTACEEALGASFVGKRALVSMKHVGLNVAADPFINAALLDINGGIVVAVADDPGMHSSQNEQDSRFYVDLAKVICLEPRNQQEAYEMTREAFDLSERFRIPVMVRLVTRLAHSRAVVRVGEPLEERLLHKAEDRKSWTLLPAYARRRFKVLLDKQRELHAFTEGSAHNRISLSSDFDEYGVITTGIAENYYMENIQELSYRPSHLHIGAYPIPEGKVRRLADCVKRLVILEEGYPFVEKYLRGIIPPQIQVDGKLNGRVGITGELDPDNTRGVLRLKERRGGAAVPGGLPGRPPQLCAGCPHTDTYNALRDALSGYSESIVTSDIGCYTLGALPPHNIIETCVCMGASIGMAKGAAEAGFYPVVAAIGDSTFLHSGITPLVDASVSDVNMTVIIMDNNTVAMTGGQQTVIPSEKLRKLIEGIGVDPEHIREIIPLEKNRRINTQILREEIEHRGLSVILAVRECVEIRRRK